MLQMTYLSALGSFVIELNSTTLPLAEEYATVNLLSGSHSLSVEKNVTFSFDDFTLLPSATISIPEQDNGLFAPAEQVLTYGSYSQAFLENIAGNNYTCNSFGGWKMTNFSYVCEVEFEENNETNKIAVWYDRYGRAVLFVATPEEVNGIEVVPEDPHFYYCVDEKNYKDYILIEVSDDEYVEPGSTEDLAGVRYLILRPDNENEGEGNNETTEAQQIYLFDDNGRILTGVDYSDMYVTTIEYVTDGAYDAISKVTDLVGNSYVYTYTNDKVTSIAGYDSNNTPLKYGTGNDAPNLVTGFSYDALGRLASITYPDGTVTSITYDASGRLWKATDADISELEFTYNVNGYVTDLIKRVVGENNTLAVSNSVNVVVPQNEPYVREFTYASGDQIIKTFDSEGNIITVVDGDGNYIIDNRPMPTPTEPTTVPAEPTTVVYGCSVCSNCEEPNCPCTCASEAECTCPQCKRYHEEVTTVLDGSLIVENIAFDGVISLTEISTYIDNGSHLSSYRDPYGNTVYYTYNNENSELISTIYTLINNNHHSTISFSYVGEDSEPIVTVNAGPRVTGYGYIFNNNNELRLSSITHNGMSYSIAYNDAGNRITLKVKNTATLLSRDLISYEYSSNELLGTSITEVVYANGNHVYYGYDTEGKLVDVGYSIDQNTNTIIARYHYSYNAQDPSSYSINDTVTHQTVTYTANGIEVTEPDGDDQIIVFSISTNPENGTVTRTCFDHSADIKKTTNYEMATGATSNNLTYTSIVSGDGQSYETEDLLTTHTDWFGRITEKTISEKSRYYRANRYVTGDLGTYSYEYADDLNEQTASAKISGFRYQYESANDSIDREMYYEYDANGNITGVYNYIGDVKNYLNQYSYDGANQLIQEYIASEEKVITYEYDDGGNLILKNEYYSTDGSYSLNEDALNSYSFSFGDSIWNDVITSYFSIEKNSQNQTITEIAPIGTDDVGNIICYGETQPNVPSTTLYWTSGGLLDYIINDNKKTQFYYDPNGVLIRKEILLGETDENSQEIHYTTVLESNNYVWYNGKLLAQRKTDSNGQDTTLEYIYDYTGEVEMIAMGVFRFLLEKDLQGNVVGISLLNIAYPSQSYRLVDFSYDAYGVPQLPVGGDNPIGAMIYLASADPILYRGYLGIGVGDLFCYYTGSRFYAPTLGRYINANFNDEAFMSVNGANVFAYCGNNPVMFTDVNGIPSEISFINTCSLYKALVEYINENFNLDR